MKLTDNLGSDIVICSASVKGIQKQALEMASVGGLLILQGFQNKKQLRLLLILMNNYS